MQRRMNGRVRSLVVAIAMLAILGASAASMAASAASMAASAPGTGKLVNLNTANVEELMGIPGIGAAKANAIIANRQEGTFSEVGDLVRVKGIGEKLLAKISPFVTTATKPGTAGKGGK